MLALAQLHGLQSQKKDGDTLQTVLSMHWRVMKGISGLLVSNACEAGKISLHTCSWPTRDWGRAGKRPMGVSASLARGSGTVMFRNTCGQGHMQDDSAMEIATLDCQQLP